jgi:heme-degrading monooxygenase HmoA
VQLICPTGPERESFVLNDLNGLNILNDWNSRRTKMIHEIVIQHVASEKRDEYIQMFGDYLKKANYAGSHGIKFFTSIEDPSRVVLMIEWDSVEAHTRHRGTPTHNAMRKMTARYQTQKSDGGHFLLQEVK